MILSSNVNDSVNFVKDNIANSIDLNPGSNTKYFTITPSSSHKNYKNSNTDILLRFLINKIQTTNYITLHTFWFHKSKVYIMELKAYRS